jgi:hypothetical protein
MAQIVDKYGNVIGVPGAPLTIQGDPTSPTGALSVSISGGGVNLLTQLSGEKRPQDGTYSWLDDGDFVYQPILLHSTSANSVIEGVVQNGTSVDGTAKDSRLVYICIPVAATAITLTVVGVAGEDGTSRSITFTGPTSGSDLHAYPNILNFAGYMRLTASVADKVLVGVAPGIV